MESVEGLFLDGTCPVCGRYCGNGGRGLTLKCQCGWSGSGINKEDAKVLSEIIQRHIKKNQEDGRAI